MCCPVPRSPSVRGERTEEIEIKREEEEKRGKKRRG
jgi:hypothetical protein